MFYVYILKSLIFGRYYIGSCDNIEKRLFQHNGGKVKSTKAFTPWKLMKQEEFMTRKEAIIRERRLKSWKSRTAIERLIAEHF